MIIIYTKEKQKVQELIDKILQEHPEYGEVTVISDLNELSENIKISEVIDNILQEHTVVIVKNLKTNTRYEI